MRVTGGKARGIPLRVPPGPVRPATDYLREAVFSSLAVLIPGARVLDLFAGTGAYGLESLSRGAASAVAVDKATASTLVANAAAVAKSMGAPELPLEVVTADALTWRPAVPDFDLVFVDPPWELWEREAARLSAAASAAAAPGAHVRLVLEGPGGFAPPLPAGWECRKVLGKGKGQPAVAILARV
jgi:16S rRNA (guanine966-N2)-methyltransferase